MSETDNQQPAEKPLTELEALNSIDKTLKWIKGFCIFLVVFCLVNFLFYYMVTTGTKW